jgi:hypothetical protein
MEVRREAGSRRGHVTPTRSVISSGLDTTLRLSTASMHEAVCSRAATELKSITRLYRHCDM